MESRHKAGGLSLHRKQNDFVVELSGRYGRRIEDSDETEKEGLLGVGFEEVNGRVENFALMDCEFIEEKLATDGLLEIHELEVVVLVSRKVDYEVRVQRIVPPKIVVGIHELIVTEKVNIKLAGKRAAGVDVGVFEVELAFEVCEKEGIGQRDCEQIGV